MNDALGEPRRMAHRVAAAGTDPDHLAAIVAWSAQSRHHPDALRRRYLDADRDRRTPDDGRPRQPGHLLEGEAVTPESIAASLAGMVGAPTATQASAATQLLRDWERDAVRVTLVGDDAYPGCLAEGWPDLDPPVWLAWRGQPPGPSPGVAIVGARRATGYGTGIAAWLAEAVADAGVRIVSGGALGVDAAAHQASHDRPGGTTVVLGCGHRIAYPRPHARAGGLFDRILDEGGTLVSEALPHEPPRAHQIRSRNRIVAGLAQAVVVVEGGDRSGSLLTAGAAAERGRTVLAVPGDVRAAGSAAPHRLLAEGAGPCCSPSQLLDAVQVASRIDDDGGQAPGRSAPHAAGGGAETRIVASMPTSLPPAVHRELATAWPRPLRLEDLARRAGVPVGSLLAALTRARVNGEVTDAADGLRLRRAPTDTASDGR